MANAHTITGLVNDIFVARDLVARELVGAIPSVMINGGSEGAAQNTTIRSIRSGAGTLNTTITPGPTVPNTDDAETTSDTMTLDKVLRMNYPILGETDRALDQAAGPGAATVRQQAIAQRLRQMVNKVEQEVCLALKLGASRAVGTAGSTPFASNLDAAADLCKILDDNGTPQDGQRSLVMSTATTANLRKLLQLQKANEYGSDALLRRGTLLDLMGFMLKQSAGIATHTKGTGASYLIDFAAGYAIDSRTIHVDTGTGTFVPGDVITIADDPAAGKYVVNTGFAGDGDGDVVLNYPGLRGAVVNNKAVTIGNSYTPNLAFHQMACELAIRPYANPEGGDAAVEQGVISDPVSGLNFSFSIYEGYKMNILEFTAVYGVKVWKPEYVALLLG